MRKGTLIFHTCIICDEETHVDELNCRYDLGGLKAEVVFQAIFATDEGMFPFFEIWREGFSHMCNLFEYLMWRKGVSVE
jgi:hypothetical protein